MSTDAKNTWELPSPVRAFCRYVRWFCWGCCILLAVVMLMQIFLRTATSIPVAWSDEVLKITFTWLGLLATVTTMWDKGHIAVDSFVRWMPPKMRYVAMVLERFMTFALMAVLVPFMWDLVVVAQGQTTLTMKVPMTLLYVAFPVCFVLLAIYHAADLYRVIRAGVQS